jgi:serine/threonine protein phosphatase PrpC
MHVCDTSVSSMQEDRFGPRPGHLLMVADGMGGYKFGEHASRHAIQFMTGYIVNLMQTFLVIDPQNDHEFRESLRDGFRRIQRMFQLEGTIDPARAKVGTTLTVSYIVWPWMYTVHAGDSRCYLLRNGGLNQITTDHTIAEMLLSVGQIPDDQIGGSAMHHTLWNALSAGTHIVEPDVIRTRLKPCDSVLLCSDGLTRHLWSEDIVRNLTEGRSADEVCEICVRTANERGGRDNITVVVGHKLQPPAEDDNIDCDETDVVDALADTVVSV